MNTFPVPIGRLFTGLFVIGALLITSLPAAATVPSELVSTDDPPTLIKHLRTELRAKDPIQRKHALLDVIALSSCPERCTLNLKSGQNKKLHIENETGLGATVDLDVLVPEVLETYRRGPTDGHRLLALSALINIGNEKALERLIDESSPRSVNVERATHRSLAAYYLTMYPELTEKTVRSRKLSLDDVNRAKVLRAKIAKN